MKRESKWSLCINPKFMNNRQSADVVPIHYQEIDVTAPLPKNPINGSISGYHRG